MNLPPLNISVLPQLAHTGALEHHAGILDLENIKVGRRHFGVAGGIAYELTLTNTGEAVLVSGSARAKLDTACDRCLEPAHLELHGEVEGYYLFEVSSAKGGESAEEYECVNAEGCVDIAPAVLAAIVVELPTVALCGPNCEGLMNPAGSAAQAASGGASQGASQDSQANAAANADSPFAALKDLLQ